MMVGNMLAMGAIMLALGVIYPLKARAQTESVSAGGVLSAAKIAGACGILDSMLDFQLETKLEGGNDFVARFWQAESARLGMTVEEMSETCDKAIMAYNVMFEDAGGTEKEVQNAETHD